MSSSSQFKAKLYEYFETQFSSYISDFFNRVETIQFPLDASTLYFKISPEAFMKFDGSDLGIVVYCLSEDEQVIEIERMPRYIMEHREPTCTPSIFQENEFYISEEDGQYASGLLFTVENLMIYLGEMWHAKERKVSIKLITHIHDSHTSYDLIKREWIKES